MSGSKTGRTFAMIMALGLSTLAGGALAASEDKLAQLLTALTQIGRKVVSDHQAVINHPEKGDKGFTAEFLAEGVATDFGKATSIDLRKPAGEDGKLMVALLDALKEVVGLLTYVTWSTAVVTGIVLLVVWQLAQRLRPARAYDLDPTHVALALGRQRGSRAACWLAERQLRREGQVPGIADRLARTQ